MRKLYLITFDDWISQSALEKCLSEVVGTENCFHSMPHSMFVISNSSARDLYDKIVDGKPSHGRVYVTESPSYNAYGWMPKDHWRVIHEQSVVHEYSLCFDGYWMQGREAALPAQPGIYCVYAATYNSETNRVSLRRLLYIGKAKDVRARHSHHEGIATWRDQLGKGEILCYSVAPLDGRSLAVCEAAMIYKHQPVCNDMGKESFSHGTTHIVTSGRNARLGTDFTVERAE